MICLIVSVEKTVVIPIFFATSSAKDDFPVPEVPANRIIIGF